MATLVCALIFVGLDDTLVFAPNEQLALHSLEMVFERLKVHNFKLATKKAHLRRSSVTFLGHIVDMNGIAINPEKVKAIVELSERDLMVESSNAPSPPRFDHSLTWWDSTSNCLKATRITKPLFALTSDVKRSHNSQGKRTPPVTKTFTCADWTPDCRETAST